MQSREKNDANDSIVDSRRLTRCCSSSFYVLASQRRFKKWQQVASLATASTTSVHTVCCRRRPRRRYYYYWWVNIWFRFNNIFISSSSREAGDRGTVRKARPICDAHTWIDCRLATRSHVPMSSSEEYSQCEREVFHRQNHHTRTHTSLRFSFSPVASQHTAACNHVAHYAVLDLVILILLFFCTHVPTFFIPFFQFLLSASVRS